jgi:hypothetical protein
MPSVKKQEAIRKNLQASPGKRPESGLKQHNFRPEPAGPINIQTPQSSYQMGMQSPLKSALNRNSANKSLGSAHTLVKPGKTVSISPTKKGSMSKKELDAMSKKIAQALSSNPDSMDSFIQAQVNIKGKEVSLKDVLKIK